MANFASLKITRTQRTIAKLSKDLRGSAFHAFRSFHISPATRLHSVLKEDNHRSSSSQCSSGFNYSFNKEASCTPSHQEGVNEEGFRRSCGSVQSIKEMLDLQAIKEIPPDSRVFISHVFTVPKVERGVEYARRFILNLKVSSH